MADRDSSEAQFPPSDVERLEVIARLIQERITTLSTAKTAGSFTAQQARELYVLEQLRDDWILEGRK